MADFLLIHGACHGAWCWRDMAAPLDFQLELAKVSPRERRFNMPTGHSPFFADPKGLAKMLDRVSGQF